MKNKIGKALIVIVSVIVFVFLYIKLDNLLESKDSLDKYNEFYRETGEYDVLFLGSSHMMNTIYPMELWKEFGITSYNMANSAEALPGSYWVLKNALEFKKPDVVVVDCFMSGYFKTFPEQESLSHMFYDALPLSESKIAAIEDLLPEQKDEFLWEFSLYHNRWNELSEEDFNLSAVPYRGAQVLTGHSNQGEVLYTDEAVAVNGLAKEYISMMKELCDENDIQLVLCCMPYAATESEQQVHNGFYQLADELDIEYLNLISAEVVDYEIDMSNRGHLNASGAKKVTSYIGQWIMENCNVTANNDLDSWSEDYEYYLQEKYRQIKNQSVLYSQLLLLHDEDVKVTIVLKEEDLLIEDPILEKFINNITHLTLEYSNEADADIQVLVFTMSDEVIDHKSFNAIEGASKTYVKTAAE